MVRAFANQRQSWQCYALLLAALVGIVCANAADDAASMDDTMAMYDATPTPIHDENSWQVDAMPWLPNTDEWNGFETQAMTTTSQTVRIGSGSYAGAILLSYCSWPYVSVATNITNNETFTAFGGLAFYDNPDGYPQSMSLPIVDITDSSALTFVITLRCYDNYTTPLNYTAIYTYIVDPLEVINITRPVITTVYGDSSTYTVTVTCNGGSGLHELYVGSTTTSIIASNASSYTFTVSSSTPTAIALNYTCANPLTLPLATATQQFVFNVDGCITLATGSLDYCEGAVLYPIDSRIDITEADNRARAAYEYDVYNHWNGTGWLPSPNVTLVYDNATGTWANVTDTIVTISSNCLAFRRRWYCAQQFPYCLQSVWPTYQSGPCRGVCSQVVSTIRCGSAYDNYPRCDLLQSSSWAAPTSQANTATQYNAVTGFGEFLITVRSYDDGLCAAAPHTITPVTALSLTLLTLLSAILAVLTR